MNTPVLMCACTFVCMNVRAHVYICLRCVCGIWDVHDMYVCVCVSVCNYACICRCKSKCIL